MLRITNMVLLLLVMSIILKGFLNELPGLTVKQIAISVPILAVTFAIIIKHIRQLK